VLDEKLAAFGRANEISITLVREACILHRLPTTSTAYWQGWNRLRTNAGDNLHTLVDAVRLALAQTPRSSSLVENLNSRLRNYFTLRRHLLRIENVAVLSEPSVLHVQPARGT
jgi:hypothetical protein